MKKVVMISCIVTMLTFYSSAEMWVGRAASYQPVDGTITASGERFDSMDYKAACNGFRIGAEVNVINTETGKSVKVIINDRVPEGLNYFILLTLTAAKELEIEKDTGLVIVEAQFSDINSSERLMVGGLIPEGEVDLERLKRFPDIDLPDEENTITHSDNTETDINKFYPEIEEELLTPMTRYAETLMDYDTNDYYRDKTEDQATVETDEKITEYPVEDSLRKPDQFAYVEKIDNDRGRFDHFFEDDKVLLVPESDKRILPTTRNPETVVIGSYEDDLMRPDEYFITRPVEKENIVKIDSDHEEPDDEVIETPIIEGIVLKPEIVKRETIIDFDKEYYEPFIDDTTLSLPRERAAYDHLIDEDLNELLFAYSTVEKVDVIPDETEDIIVDPTDDNIEVVVDPTDDNIEVVVDPTDDKVEIVEEKIENDGSSFSWANNLGNRKNNETVEVKVDETKDVIVEEVKLEPVNWISQLDNSQVYIRVSTCFNVKEGERRFRLFDKLFTPLVAYNKNNKYIILVGPFPEEKAATVLSNVRMLGFKDAYLFIQ